MPETKRVLQKIVVPEHNVPTLRGLLQARQLEKFKVKKKC